MILVVASMGLIGTEALIFRNTRPMVLTKQTGTLLGYTSAFVGFIPNYVVRFFIPDTQTELRKAVVYTTISIGHVANDATNIVTSAAATDQATVNTLLNEIKADYNAHRVSTTFHSNADTVNAVTSADSSSEATAITLSNEIKADYNAHRFQATIHPYNDRKFITTVADSTNLATAITLANELKSLYNSHRTFNIMFFNAYGIPIGTYDIGIKSDVSQSLLAQDVIITTGTSIATDFGYIWQADVNGNDYSTGADSLVLTKAVTAGIVGDCAGWAGNWSAP
jgi:hypothetical protein